VDTEGPLELRVPSYSNSIFSCQVLASWSRTTNLKIKKATYVFRHQAYQDFSLFIKVATRIHQLSLIVTSTVFAVLCQRWGLNVKNIKVTDILIPFFGGGRGRWRWRCDNECIKTQTSLVRQSTIFKSDPTRLVIVYFGQFFEITEIAHIFGLLFPVDKFMH
jgi:hypothetical protein